LENLVKSRNLDEDGALMCSGGASISKNGEIALIEQRSGNKTTQNYGMVVI
jgi:hypothetical protein